MIQCTDEGHGESLQNLYGTKESIFLVMDLSSTWIMMEVKRQTVNTVPVQGRLSLLNPNDD